MCNVHTGKEEEEITPHLLGMFPSFTHDRLLSNQNAKEES